jgi:hypothetical protein
MNELNNVTLTQTLETIAKMPVTMDLAQLTSMFSLIYEGIGRIKEDAWNEGYEQALEDEGVFALDEAEEEALADRVMDKMYSHLTDENGFGGQRYDDEGYFPLSSEDIAAMPEKGEERINNNDWYFRNEHDKAYPHTYTQTF